MAKKRVISSGFAFKTPKTGNQQKRAAFQANAARVYSTKRGIPGCYFMFMTGTFPWGWAEGGRGGADEGTVWTAV